jgi:signal transduction histidine kinase
MANSTVEKLKARLEEVEEGTAEHVDAMNDLAWELWSIDIDYTTELTERAYEMAKELEYERGFAFAQRTRSLMLYGRGEVEEALSGLTAAKSWFHDHGEVAGEASACNGLAYVYWGFGEFRRGFELAERARKLNEEAGSQNGLGWTLSALGGFYHDWNDHQQSMDLYNKACELFTETGHVIGQARCLNGIGSAHQLLGHHEKALEYQRRSLELHRSAQNEFGVAKAYNDIGLVYQDMEEFDEALRCHRASLEIRERGGYLQGMATCLLDIASSCIALRDYDEATKALDRALVVSEKIKSKPKMRRAHELFSQLYRDLGKFDAALVHFENFHRLTEEVFNEDFEQKLKNLRSAHEIEASEREAEIYRLRSVELHDKNVELEKTLKELHTAQAQLLQDGKMAALGNLVAGLVHEVNTPIGAIKSSSDTALRAIERLYAGLYPDGEGDAAHRSILDVLHTNANTALSSAERIEEIAWSLRNFAHLDEAPFQRVDINEGIESTLTLIGHELGDRIRVVKELGELPRIFVYPSELNQVFMNLLLNAAQAVDGEGTISVRSSLEDGRVRVEVADDGRGIPPEKLEHLFEPGFTKKHSTVRMRTGLYTSYNIVRNHLGELTVESRVGEGTTFRVSIPIDLEKTIGGGAE